MAETVTKVMRGVIEQELARSNRRLVDKAEMLARKLEAAAATVRQTAALEAGGTYRATAILRELLWLSWNYGTDFGEVGASYDAAHAALHPTYVVSDDGDAADEVVG